MCIRDSSKTRPFENNCPVGLCARARPTGRAASRTSLKPRRGQDLVGTATARRKLTRAQTH
eukprot:2494858-Alexandrium_andersonii.AAC.1